MQSGKHKKLDIDNVQLDLDNPRISRFIEIYEGEISPIQIAQALGFGGESSNNSGPNFYSLKESIKTHKGIIHPIIVNHTEGKGNIVIEGNTRLAIFQDFFKKNIPGNWDKIPSIVYNDLSQEEIDAIRLQAHLVGPRQWDPYSKAKYLHYLNDYESMPFNRLVDYCGGRESEVRKFIAAYEDIEDYYRPAVEAADEDFDIKRFSGYLELQKPAIKQSLLTAKYTIADFSKWVVKGLFDRNEHVRNLPKILKNKEAKDVFLRKGSREALKVFDKDTDGSNLSDASFEAV